MRMPRSRRTVSIETSVLPTEWTQIGHRVLMRYTAKRGEDDIMQPYARKPMSPALLVPLLIGLTACNGVDGGTPQISDLPTMSSAETSITSELVSSLVNFMVEGKIPSSFIPTAAGIIADKSLRTLLERGVGREFGKRPDNSATKYLVSEWLAEAMALADKNPRNLPKWLADNPVGCTQSRTEMISSVNGQHPISDPNQCYRVKRIGPSGKLTVNGGIVVTIEYCNGRIYLDRNHRVTILRSGPSCRYE